MSRRNRIDGHPQTIVRLVFLAGPVGVMIKFSTEDEAVAIANDCDYALAAGVRHALLAPCKLPHAHVRAFFDLPAFGRCRCAAAGVEAAQTPL